MPVLKVLAALASQQEGVSLALKAVTQLMQNAAAQGREVSREELEGLSLGAHSAVESLRKALEE